MGVVVGCPDTFGHSVYGKERKRKMVIMKWVMAVPVDGV